MAKFQGFPADTLKFLNALKKNNQRDWFNERKERYEKAFVEPALEFITHMQPHFDKISPRIVVNPRKSGGNLLRIYRDTRFSRDKAPYKTNMGIHFPVRSDKGIHSPGFYLHVEPGNVFLGAGIWHPETKIAYQIRRLIDEKPEYWKKTAHSRSFLNTYYLDGDSLKRPPRGFDSDHPYIEDLKRKDFIGVHQIEDFYIEKPLFLKETVKAFKKAVPLVRFICEATDLPF